MTRSRLWPRLALLRTSSLERCFVAFPNGALGQRITRYKIAIKIAPDHSDLDCSLLLLVFSALDHPRVTGKRENLP